MEDMKLINFNASVGTRRRFDAICHASGRTRTSVLVELMTNYILHEGKRLADRQKELGDLDMRFQESLGLKGSNTQMETYHRSVPSPRQTWGDREFDLPEPIFSDGREVW
ncbi:hypothetical protein [Novosphingobium sp. PASSN1]|uniref:hypothetical protein n=1 Tax=Novosphingobium sp. PASSN1 TaxID=2015561 RepID=UPI000BD150D2|nr:hypothetical protein [Novosphingobium sp. PASSN1]OYU33187.1 MAG: hypothetical protein CFE35_21605 [Novosphingobium sp. PASSN1]